MSKFRVSFHGSLHDPDFARLTAPEEIEWEFSGNDVRPEAGVISHGAARHVVVVDAPDQAAAVRAVRDALRDDTRFGDWHSSPA